MFKYISKFKIVWSILNVMYQKHFLWTICAPDSSYSACEIHMVLKELSPERMLPPIHTENLLSGGATT
jgi:hypothetical protein